MFESKKAIIQLLIKEVYRFNQCAAKGLDCSHNISRIDVYEKILNTVFDCDLIFSYGQNGSYSFACYSRKRGKFISLESI